MKATYDKVADAMYIYLTKPRKRCVKETVKLNDNILIDLGEDKKLLGIEILSASFYLHKSELKNAQKITA